MSANTPRDAAPSPGRQWRWEADRLVPLGRSDETRHSVEVVDSWLLLEGKALALELHRTRFLDSIAARGFDRDGGDDFWSAMLAALPRRGEWFPRVELASHDTSARFQLTLRVAPARSRSIVLSTHRGDDPRTAPTIKGPDLDALNELRENARRVGADEAILLSAGGSVVDGAHTAILWWRGETLCAPASGLERIDSVTARSLIMLATALGTTVSTEEAAPEELDGLEIWALNALHGIRIVTRWIDGPATAEQPGRLGTWRRLLDSLRKPVLPPIESAG